MKCFRIKYRKHPAEEANVIEVLANSPEQARKKAGLQDGWGYLVWVHR